jgi:glycosyltransferase involved in cell wall biosynthesis
MLLRAFRIVVDELPTARLLVVGDGPERARLEKLSAELGLTGQVTFTGDRADIPDVLTLVDVITLCSYSIECFPMALLEAMAAGRPAVCTAVGGVPELVEQGVTGYLVPPHEPAALADRLLALLRDRATARRFGAAARHAVETRFSLGRSVEAAAAALERVARRTDGRAEPVRLTLVLDLTFVGGAETVLLETFRHLDPAVVRPRVVCLREAGPLADDFRASGFEVDVLDRAGRFDLSTVPRLWRSLRSHRTDVVLVAHHHRAALALGRLVGRLAGARTVVAAHDMDLTSVGRRCLPRSTVETLFLSDALVLLAPSQGEYLHREEGVGRFPWRRTREVVIPNGIPIPSDPDPATRADVRMELGYQDDDVVVGIVARLSRQKAHQVLFEAVARLAGRYPQLKLLVVGDGTRAAELTDLARELGIADRTRFAGIRRDVPRLLTGLDISCLSSVHEGVPITVLESMAAALPVVATECGALRDLVEEGGTGHLVPVGDVAALAARLGELTADAQLRTRLGAAGRARAEREFGIERTARGLEQLLTELTRRHR